MLADVWQDPLTATDRRGHTKVKILFKLSSMHYHDDHAHGDHDHGQDVGVDLDGDDGPVVAGSDRLVHTQWPR